jgi:hypothetical protein
MKEETTVPLGVPPFLVMMRLMNVSFTVLYSVTYRNPRTGLIETIKCEPLPAVAEVLSRLKTGERIVVDFAGAGQQLDDRRKTLTRKIMDGSRSSLHYEDIPNTSQTAFWIQQD